MTIDQFRKICVFALMLAFTVSACKKVYTREEATNILKKDERFTELIRLKVESRAILQTAFRTTATPEVVKKYMRAKENKDEAYLKSIRDQIKLPLMENKKKEAILYAALYKKYVIYKHFPKEIFRDIIKSDYKAKIGKIKQ